MNRTNTEITEKGWLNLEVPGRQSLVNTPLALVLCQVRFSLILGVQQESLVANFHEAIKADYPIAFPPEQRVAEVQVTVGNAISMAPPSPSIIWKFTDLQNNWTAVLASDFVALETREYAGFEDFSARLDRILSALSASANPPVTTRIGLRYVNEIRPSHSNWTIVIKPEILGVMSVPELAASASQTVQQVSLRDKEGLRVHFRHGAFADGTTVEPREGVDPRNGPFYLLDIDSFQEFVSSAWAPFEPVAIISTVGQLHNAASTIFRWSLLDSFITSLGKEANDSKVN